MNLIQQLEAEQTQAVDAKRKLPEFSSGDSVRVRVRVTEGARTRIQTYEGVCIARKGSGLNESFCVRKISYGEGVERVFPVYSPLVEGVEVVRRGRVRRAKLYYLRGLRGKSARITENTGTRAKELAEAERAAFLAEKERLEAEKIAAAEQLAKEKADEEAKAAEQAKDAEQAQASEQKDAPEQAQASEQAQAAEQAEKAERTENAEQAQAAEQTEASETESAETEAAETESAETVKAAESSENAESAEQAQAAEQAEETEKTEPKT